jgi:Cu+-exporting ATPase
MSYSAGTDKSVLCYHCGEECFTRGIQLDNKSFCCEGCKLVFQILNKNGLCEYYNLNENPGVSQRITVRKDKYSFLEDKAIQAKLISFSDETQVHVSFYLPQIHCSSCLYLLEKLHKLDIGVISCQVNFARKEADIVFLKQQTTLRKVVELLTGIGYEPCRPWYYLLIAGTSSNPG